MKDDYFVAGSDIYTLGAVVGPLVMGIGFDSSGSYSSVLGPFLLLPCPQHKDAHRSKSKETDCYIRCKKPIQQIAGHDPPEERCTTQNRSCKGSALW